MVRRSTKRRPGEVSTIVEVGSDAGSGSQRMDSRIEMSPWKEEEDEEEEVAVMFCLYVVNQLGLLFLFWLFFKVLCFKLKVPCFLAPRIRRCVGCCSTRGRRVQRGTAAMLGTVHRWILYSMHCTITYIHR